VNYPNDFDRAMARKEGRDRPGSDIMIHGKDASIGCLAMGDRAAEELFTLAADAGLTQIRVVLSPVDFRTTELPSPTPPAPPWMTGVYQQVRAALAELR
jgi:murein L,D-transpeptidase YafK